MDEKNPIRIASITNSLPEMIKYCEDDHGNAMERLIVAKPNKSIDIIKEMKIIAFNKCFQRSQISINKMKLYYNSKTIYIFYFLL